MLIALLSFLNTKDYLYCWKSFAAFFLMAEQTQELIKMHMKNFKRMTTMYKKQQTKCKITFELRSNLLSAYMFSVILHCCLLISLLINNLNFILWEL